MARITVVGSGPSGVHFALSALEQGHSVEMIDVGRTGMANVNPQDSFTELKDNLADPAAYFLGRDYDGVLLPGQQEDFYGIPPSKNYALELPAGLERRTHGFEPMFSFARGGLAEMWTGGCYPFNDDDLAAYPFGYEELEPYYTRIAQRIGINGTEDDLAAFLPVHGGLQEPLRLDDHSAQLLARYQADRQQLQQRFGCYMGRARHAVLSRDLGTRKACRYLGRCIWGCPTGALYTPAGTLDDCLQSPGFSYQRDYLVTHFNYDENGRVRSVQAESVTGAAAREFAVETLVLAAGALGTSKIYLESIYRNSGELVRLPGLMDNRQALVPFVNLHMLGKRWQPDSYQYNQLAMGFEGNARAEYVHCLVTTLKTAMLHPVIEKFPFDLRTSLYLFRNLHAALGVVNVNFHDTRRDSSYVSLDVAGSARRPALVIHYTPPAGEAARIEEYLRRLRKVLWRLGCIVPPGMVHVRPMGASVHYAGTLPMSPVARPHTVGPDCRSHDFGNLYIADGTSYPYLPAKNITFTLMANAARVADRMNRAV
jgi:choline dehydrogenase-like flavoprotein